MTERILDMSSPGAEVRTRKTRASKPKVKTGCQTCKIRRVKCDETKPNCLRCLKFGHQCDGYLPRPTSKPCAGSSSNSRLLVPKSSSGSLSILAQAEAQAQAQAQVQGGSSSTEEREVKGNTNKQPKLYPAPPLPAQTTTQQLFSTPHEHHAFTQFCATTSQHLANANSNLSSDSSSFTPSLWTSLMHRACETSPAIRGAVIALGGLNLQEPSSGLGWHANENNINGENGVGTLRHQFAFRQYSKALCYLRRDVAGGKHDLRTTLVASLLFYCFESMGMGVPELQEGGGGGGGGVSQVYAGLRLIREWASGFYGAGEQEKIRDGSEGTGGEDLVQVENDIMRAFGGLEIQVMLYADGRTREAHEAYRRIGQAAVDDMSSIFPDLESARSVLEIVIRRSMHWLRSTMHLHIFATGPESGPGSASRDLQGEGDGAPGQGNLFFDVDSTFAERLTTLSEYERWDAAFCPLLNHARSRSAPHETFILASTLRLHWLAGYMSIDSNNSRSALVNHGKYTILLQELVGIARLLLDEQERERNREHVKGKGGRGGWTFDMQIIVPLLTVGWIYRHRTLRREAIELLLRSPRKEGVWDGVVVGKVMRWLAEIEDEGSEGGDGEFVAEEAMARCIRMGFDDVRREASVSCLQPVKGSLSGKEERRSVVIPW